MSRLDRRRLDRRRHHRRQRFLFDCNDDAYVVVVDDVVVPGSVDAEECDERPECCQFFDYHRGIGQEFVDIVDTVDIVWIVEFEVKSLDFREMDI